MPLEIEHQVTWGEQDSLGHVNNTVFFRYFENARIAHFEQIGLTFPKPGETGYGPILASTECTFLRPLLYPDRVRIEVHVTHLGNSSFTHLYKVYSYGQQAYVAEGKGVNVYYDYSAAKSAPLPPHLRAALESSYRSAS